jgi:geranyl-CoA carboxylase alpha subunit
MFHTLLVANRGEIACRVLRTAQRMGYRTVAVYSEADAGAPHTRLADLAVCIGPAPAAESYLNIAALLQAARASGAAAIHPGYGFLSERADFAAACEAAGLVFVGPPSAAIAAMGSKAEAKRRMLAAGVPCVPGCLGEQQDDATLLEQAQALGLPLLIKAVAGGGGRGMRVLRRWDEWPEALDGARREAGSAFGDRTVMLERLIEPARHIEVQVFADAHGHLVHLGERDCSTQRRRQKIIEEAPSPAVSPALRERLCADAIAAARAVEYRGAGTVEFIVDDAGQHFFLEMNTRLQVEHTVTECITGLDLVEWQLRVAAGEPLPLAQHAIHFEGHAIELRLCAEDPHQGFRPATGTVAGWRPQRAERDGVRVDHGIADGQTITPHYDSLVAKFVAHGRTRADAIRRLRRALEVAPLLAPVNNGGFLHTLLGHDDFIAAGLHTGSLDAWGSSGAPELQAPAPPEAAWRAAAALLGGRADSRAGLSGLALQLRCQDRQRSLHWPVPGVQLHAWQGHDAHLTIDGVDLRLRATPAPREPGAADAPGALLLAWGAQVLRFEEPSPWPEAVAARADSRVCAPVAGVVARLSVEVGDHVAPGQPLVCVEAMKMEMWQNAPVAGTVQRLAVALRQSVAAGDLLIELEPDPT